MSVNTGIQTICPSVLEYLNLRCLFWAITFPKAKKVDHRREEKISIAALKGEWGAPPFMSVLPWLCCCTRWEGHRLPWSNLSDFWLANAVHPSPPITSPFPSPFLLPSCKFSLFCYRSTHPNLLLQTSSSPAFLTNTCCSPSFPTLAHLLFAGSSSSLGVLHLLHVLHLHLMPSFPGSLQYLSHPRSLLQLFSQLLLLLSFSFLSMLPWLPAHTEPPPDFSALPT